MSTGVDCTRAFLTGLMVAGRGARVRRRVRLSGSPGSDVARRLRDGRGAAAAPSASSRGALPTRDMHVSHAYPPLNGRFAALCGMRCVAAMQNQRPSGRR